jgi:hypothetical protein
MILCMRIFILGNLQRTLFPRLFSNCLEELSILSFLILETIRWDRYKHNKKEKPLIVNIRQVIPLIIIIKYNPVYCFPFKKN